MWIRIAVGVTLVAFVNMMYGCSHTVKMDKGDLKSGYERIVKIAKVDGSIIEFDEDGARFIVGKEEISGYVLVSEDADIQGRSVVKSRLVPVSVPIDSVMQVWVHKSNPAATVFATIGVAAAVVLVVAMIAAALKESCPFVYSWDGDKYQFDAEPLGGAICQVLQRSECSRLDYLKEADGKYRIMFRNEVEEIQYLDDVKLVVVDHDAKTVIVPDTAGNMHVVSGPVRPASATDEHHRDILTFITESDGLAWQTPLSQARTDTSADTRHHLTFEFPKPTNARTAKVIVNAGTAIWGSNMIREMLQMRGAGVDAWYESVNARGPQLMELFFFNLREEMYLMKLLVQKDESWESRGLVLGGGPFVAEDRVMELDVSDIPGDRLVLKLNPPKGFWTLDYLAIQYDTHDQIPGKILEIATATDQNGSDISDRLARVDSVYYLMPRVGDWAEMTFEAPPPPENLKRSLFLWTNGYYEIQIDKTQPEQTALVKRMLNEPAAIAEYSIERYIEWYQQHLNQN